jgi:predicted RNA-binding Zn ribbon-like protein
VLLDDPVTVADAGDLDRAIALRDGLRAWLGARQGLDHDRAALGRARELLGRLRLQVGLAADLATAAATGALARLKICGAPDCQFVYDDRYRGRRQG